MSLSEVPRMQVANSERQHDKQITELRLFYWTAPWDQI